MTLIPGLRSGMSSYVLELEALVGWAQLEFGFGYDRNL